MNPIEFNSALIGLVNSGTSQGIPIPQIVLMSELIKADLIRQLQDNARESKIVPAPIILPRNGR